MPTFFTEKQIKEYKAGWYETHPEDELNDDEVESILEEEERERIIQLLMKDDLDTNITTGGDLFGMILREGFEGYNNISDIDLHDEVLVRGLKNKVWGDWYEN